MRLTTLRPYSSLLFSTILLQFAVAGCGQGNAIAPARPTSDAEIGRETPGDLAIWETDVARLSQNADFRGIVAACDRVLAEEPKNVKALVWRAYAQMDAGAFEACVKDIDAALAIEPKHTDAWVAKGDVHLRVAPTDFQGARDFYEKAIALDERCANAWRSRARSFAAEGALQEAIQDYTRSIAISREHADYFERAASYQSLNQHEAAISDFDAAIELESGIPAYYGRRSISWGKLKQFDNAVEDAGKAIELDSQNPSGYRHRAAYRVRQGKLDQAIVDWLAGIERTQDDAGSHYQPLSETSPTIEALRHGEEQLRAIVRDRPEMAQYCKPGDRLWNWAVHMLAGDGVGEPIYWNSEPLKYHAARHSYPQPQSNGWIQISPDPILREDGDGTAFEHLWACLVFELHNMTFAKDFARVVREVEAGKLQQQEYVLAVARIERQAKQLQSAFYAHVFLPWALESGFRDSEPEYWLVSLPDPDKEPDRLLQGGAHYVAGYSDNHRVMVARLDCEAGRYGKARESLEALLANGAVLEDDELSQAYFWLGTSQLATNDELVALASFKQAVAFNDQWSGEFFAPAAGRLMFGRRMNGDSAQTAGAHFCRGMAWLSSGDFAQTLDDLNKAIELEPEYVAAIVQRGQVYFATEQYDDALADVQLALRLEPTHVSALMLRGHVWAAKALPEKAQADYSEYIRRLPNLPAGWLARGCLLRAQGDYSAAMSDFSESIRIDPRIPGHFLERARLHLLQEDFEKAIADLNQALAIRPGDGPTLELRALVRADYGKPGDAIKDVNEAVRVRPDTPEPRITRGHVYAKLKDTAKALAEFTAALDLNPNHVEARIARSQVSHEIGDYDACIADLDAALKVNPMAEYVYLLRGNAWVMKKDKARAVADLDEFVRLRSSSAESLCARGEALLVLGDETGVADLDAAIMADSKYAPAYAARAKARHMQGEFSQAIADFDLALALSPRSIESRMGRAELLQDMNLYHKALADVEEAIRLAPSKSYLHYAQGKVHLGIQELEKASVDADMAISLDPANSWSHLIRGDVARARADYTAALAEYDRATELSPEEAYSFVRRAKLLSECPSPQYRDMSRAIRDATRACELTDWKASAYLSSLAACYAEAGDFKSAIEWQTKAMALAQGDWKPKHSVILEYFHAEKTLRQVEAESQTTHPDQ